MPLGERLFYGAGADQVAAGVAALEHRVGLRVPAALAQIGPQRPHLVDRMRLDVRQTDGAAAGTERQQERVARKFHFAPLSRAVGESLVSASIQKFPL